MDWQPTAKDVKAAWSRFSGAWNFEQQGDLRLPLYRPMLTAEDFAPAPEPVAMPSIPVATYSLEHGRLNGKRATRIVGRVTDRPDTEIVLETMFID